MRRALALWAAIVVPIWATLAACVAWEPMVYDGWALRIIQRAAPTTTWSNVVAFAENTYLHGNPRLGQVFSMLLYTSGPWHVLVTPLVLVALFVLATTLALGRWPSPRCTDDALAFLAVTALVIVTSPHLGPMLFHRPVTGNYTFPVVIDLALLVPYRLHASTPRRHGVATAVLVFVLGASAGLCNEHTGLALGGLLVAALVWTYRRDRGVPVWMVAGLVGFAAGYAALMLAPGQHVRYGGLADQQTIVERIADRGLVANAWIIGQFLLHVAALAPWAVLARIAPKQPIAATARTASLALAGAAAIACATILASPKLGERLYFASTVLVAIAFAPWFLARTAARPFVHWRTALAAALLVVVGWRCVAAYRELGPASDARQAIIEAAPPGSTVTIDPFPRDETWWNLGDDLADPDRREALARRLGLAAIKLR
jgi:hypothetical protein